jgi:hypothetical protein
MVCLAARATRDRPALDLPRHGVPCLFVASFSGLFLLRRRFASALTVSLSFGGWRHPKGTPAGRPASLACSVQGVRQKRAAVAANTMTNKTDKNSNETRSGAEAQSKIEQLPTDTNSQQIPQTQEEFFGLAIYTYTRKQALADGVQVDVSKLAAEAGFRIPVFLTETVHREYVQVPEGITCQDETGRLWDILWMLRNAIGKKRSDARQILFQLYVRNSDTEGAKLITLRAEIGFFRKVCAFHRKG